MNTQEFEDTVFKHSLRPNDSLYLGNGLSGETGEVTDLIKKIEIRKSLKPEQVITMKDLPHYYNHMRKELGDVLFYLTALALNLDTNLNELMKHQAEKLKIQDIQYNRIFLK